MKAFTCPSYMYFYYHLSLVSCRFFHLSCCFNFKSDFSCPLYVYCLEFHSASRSNVFSISTFQADFAEFRYTFHPSVAEIAQKRKEKKKEKKRKKEREKKIKDLGHSAGKIAQGRLQLNTHAPNLCGFDGVRL